MILISVHAQAKMSQNGMPERQANLANIQPEISRMSKKCVFGKKLQEAKGQYSIEAFASTSYSFT